MNTRVIETEAGEVEVTVAPAEGERCGLCDRRVPKKRQSSSPTTRRLVFVLPQERADYAEEALEHLQAFVGADPSSYPKGTLLELLLLLGGQNREELRRHFTERSQT